MRRPGYREAVEWLAGNDDCYWIGDYDAHGPMLSVATSMVRDLWGVTDEKIIADLKRALRKVYPNHEALRGA
jgi:enoyl reductase-like protein